MAFSRRTFCCVTGASAVMRALPVLSAEDSPSDRLRVIAYNVYGMTGWPKDRKTAKKAVAERQMAQRVAMELALYEPDLVCFSESPASALTQLVAEKLGMNHLRFPSGGSWPGTLLSRLSVIESANAPLARKRPAELFTRHWGRAIVELTDGESLVVHSAHLHPGADKAIRLREIRSMIETMKADLDSGRPMLLIGDLNHGPDSEEYKLWIDAGWTDTFAKAGEGQGKTFKSDRPQYRIDYVMAAGSMVGRLVDSRPLFQGAFRLNVEDQQSFALSDHLPQYAEFTVGGG